jgi:hypothetical protein
VWAAVASYVMILVASGWHRRCLDTNQLSSWIAELSPLSLIVAYVSIYWFATDREFPAAAA